MSDKPFHAPHVAINRVYTRHGDAGETRLVGGQKVPKNDARIDAYGTIDELNAFVGAARQTALEARAQASEASVAGLDELAACLLRVQHELFNAGSALATLPEDMHPKQPRVRAEDVARLEREMDACVLPPLRSFVLPGGARLNTDLHVARTVCRRAERAIVGLAAHAEVDPVVVAYVNRLSDAFFVWSRWATQLLGADEVLWDPNAALPAGRAG